MNENQDQFEQENQIEIPELLPLLPVKDIVVFPFMIVPLLVSREMSVNAVNYALARDRLVLLTSQKDANTEEPGPEDIYSVGCACMIMKMRKLLDGRIKVLVQGMVKTQVQGFEVADNVLLARTSTLEDQPLADEEIIQVEALSRAVKENMEKVVSLGKTISSDIMPILESIEDPGRLAELVASNIIGDVEESQAILEMASPLDRLKAVNEHLLKELRVLKMQTEIQNQAKEEITKTQREYYLREQLRAIREELGDIDSKSEEVDELRKRIDESKMPEETEKEAFKQLKRLESMNSDSAEAGVIRTYLDWLVEVPWSQKSADSIDITKARVILDEDHYDLEPIKKRILEYLGVRKLKGDHKGPIICFVGPPGVGKTSLGKSIARSIGRQFVRMSVGGMRDEAEIRGHRRTYVGAMPGKIIQGLKQAGTNNPVFMIDELDKMGSDFRGDPSSAMLEVLDPEQNHSFVDHYLNQPFDLRDVMFIATANMLDTIPAALRDRLEIIRLPGYSGEEKTHIARRFLIPKQIEENGLTEEQISIGPNALKNVIHDYTRESGLRNLERQIGSLCRKVALEIAEGRKKKTSINSNMVEKLLGPPPYMSVDQLEEEDQIGVAAGLAWTPVGGEILFIEGRLMKGRGELILTGHLGDVMKESARAALSYLRSKMDDYEIPEDKFEKHQLHIHVPAGAIPKDGPSAGVTIASTIFSVLSDRKIRRDVAMTGEITLTGKVLPIGGLKEKILAALRAGMSDIVMPYANRKDIIDLPTHIKRQFKPVFVKNIDEVFDAVIAKEENDNQEDTDEHKS